MSDFDCYCHVIDLKAGIVMPLALFSLFACFSYSSFPNPCVFIRILASFFFLRFEKKVVEIWIATIVNL